MKIEQYKTQDGVRYKFQIRLGDKVTRKGGFKSQNAAIFAYNELIKNYNDKLEGNLTFREIYEEWLEVYKTTVKETTYESATSIFRIHILPIFGDMKIEDIDTKYCQMFVMMLSQFVKGKEYFNYAKRVMDYAVRIYNLAKNPFDDVVLPNFKPPTVQIDYLEPDEVARLLDYFKGNIYWLALFRLMIYTGIRRGETLALTWDDINLKKGTLNINKTLGIGKDKKVIVSTPKTEASEAILDLDPGTVLILKEYKLQSKTDIVFPSRSGKHRRLSDISDKLKIALKELGLKEIRVHDLRHTHATLLFASGASVKYVQKRLRHTKIETTLNIYTHVTKKDKTDSLDNFVEYMTKNA